MDRFVVDGLRGHPGLLEALETLRQVVLDGGEGGHDSWRAKPVGGVREVGQVALDHIYTFEGKKTTNSTWISGSKIIAGFVLHSGDLSWFNRSISSFVTILVAKNTHSLDSSDTCKKTQRHRKQRILTWWQATAPSCETAQRCSRTCRSGTRPPGRNITVSCDIILPHGTANITEALLSQVLQAS